MRVLVAGTNVALGVTLTRRLLAAGHEVIGLSRTPANRDKLLMLGADYRWSAGVPGAKMADWEADEMHYHEQTTQRRRDHHLSVAVHPRFKTQTKES
jgi:nucleoside-diphosphate-sugar epimerase